MRSLFLLLCAVQLDAQVQLSLEESLKRALDASGLLEASRERVNTAQGLRRQALLRPNPRLILQSENTRFHGSPSLNFSRDTDTFAYLQQTFETYGRRGVRGELAAAGVARAEAERDLAAAGIRARVKHAYWAAAGVRQTERWLEEDLLRFREVVGYHETRVREGAMAEADLLRVRLEESRLRMTMSAVQLAAERARIDLLREMAQVDFPQVEFTEPFEAAGAPVQGTVEQALEQRPDVRAALRAAEQLRANIGLQQAVAKPNLDVLFGFKRTAGFNTMIGGLQADLPLANRNQGNIAAAQSELRAAEAALAAARALVRAEVAAARRAVDLRRQQIDTVLSRMREQAEESARIAAAAYKIGGIDLLRLLDTERARIETQVVYFQSLTEFHQSVAALETALGLP